MFLKNHIIQIKQIPNISYFSQVIDKFLILFHFLILDKKDNFEKLKAITGPINRLLEGELNITFFCENYISKKNVTMDSEDRDKHDILDFYVIKNGSLNKNETLTDFSKEFMAHMLNEFNLTDYLEKKYLSNIIIVLTLF